MDIDFIDVTKPRFQLQSDNGVGPSADENERRVNRVHAGICLSVGVVLLGCGWVWIGPMQWLAVWVGVSLVVGPFAPSSFTGGDCSLPVGEPVLSDEESYDDSKAVGSKVIFHRGKYPRMRDIVKENVQSSGSEQQDGELGVVSQNEQQSFESSQNGSSTKITGEVENKEWSTEELELLKKLLLKHPRGTLRRWEVISEALGGKHIVDDVVKMARIYSQKKIGDQDAYARFLAQKKGADIAIASPLSQRDAGDMQYGKAFVTDDLSGEAPLIEPELAGKGRWTETEDKALLTALKTFPKDSSMRWDKVALAVPGRSKAQCFTRFSDLRKDFRIANVAGGNSERIIM